ncbi:phage portal protein [Chelativorans sp. SCAU2101]|uniref:Phage portal protein n=1 Tax=Chelativorans petroleitrophicus TaxID=2975484 RepID=A0A9X2X771_9HYPH|nr:phage portal protein [Chelativorans petroleitrophicus]MCT8989012.1 phage portal protein [Chelativorans petroleitrophicus]
MREAYISGRRGLAELTATAQGCISLWEGALSLADVSGTDLLDRRSMAVLARSLALRGEAVFKIAEDGLVPCSDWDLRTRNGKPVAYRVSIPEAGGGTSETLLAGEVLHVRIGSDPAAPYYGQAPLKRASLTAGMLNAVEAALGEVFENAPIGSAIVPFPETPETDLGSLGRSFRGQRGRVLLRESVHVHAAGGPAPNQDWKPQSVSPDLEKSMTAETLEAARGAICGAFGVLPALFASNAQGPLVREAQRHLVQWTLQPIAALIAEEASEKLGSTVEIDVLRPVQAFDVGGRARALSTIVQALAQAKESGLSADELNTALTLVNWGQNDKAA